MKTFLMFVYGTLRRDFHNYRLLVEGNAKFIGSAITQNKFALYADGIPFVTDKEEVSQIVGEVFEVDERTLRRLDGLEGHPNWYERKETPFVFTDGPSADKTEVAWLYFNEPNRSCKLEESGDYKEYCKKHAPNYLNAIA